MEEMGREEHIGLDMVFEASAMILNCHDFDLVVIGLDSVLERMGWYSYFWI